MAGARSRGRDGRGAAVARAGRALVAAGLLALAGAPAASAATAVVVGLGNLVPTSINERGAIVGNTIIGGVGHAARWSDGRLTRLPERPTSVLSDAFAIGDGGHVVGLDETPTASVHAVRWDVTAGLVEIPPLVPQTGGDFSMANDVDATGNIVGSLYNAGGTGGIQYGFLRVARSGLLVRLTGGAAEGELFSTELGAITRDGTKVLGRMTTTAGVTYRIWPAGALGGPGVALDLTPATTNFSAIGGSGHGIVADYAKALANDGSVLGRKDGPGGRTWWVRLPDGTETQVEGLSGLQAMNDKHVVVGFVLDMRLGARAAIWNPRTRAVTLLDDLLPAGSTWKLAEAMAVSDGGAIVGIGSRNGTDQEGFLLRLRAVISGQVGAPPLPGAALTAPAARVVLTPLDGGDAVTATPNAAGRWRAEVSPGRYRVALTGVAGCATGQRPCSASRVVDAQDDVTVSFRTNATSRLAAASLRPGARLAARRGKVAITVACRLVTRPCTGIATVTRGRTVLARLAGLRIAAGGSARVRVPLTRPGKAALAATARPIASSLVLAIRSGSRAVRTTLAVRLDG